MISLFIDTSLCFPTISIVKDDKVLFNFHKEIKSDMSSMILPILDDGLTSANLSLSSINKIFVVTGPGSFTGVRIGVSIAKTIAWSLNIPIIPLSSLEFIATTNTDKKFLIPMIDARRGNVFAGIYNNELKCIKKDSLSEIDEFLKYTREDYEIVSYDNINSSVNPLPNVLTIINKHMNDIPVNPHDLKPNYLKLTEAEEKRIAND